jgi:hypothetical protein
MTQQIGDMLIGEVNIQRDTCGSGKNHCNLADDMVQPTGGKDPNRLFLLDPMISDLSRQPQCSAVQLSECYDFRSFFYSKLLAEKIELFPDDLSQPDILLHGLRHFWQPKGVVPSSLCSDIKL